MIEDLDGCKVMCDNRMQGRVDELQKKRAHLNELNDQVMECRCKLPIDVNVEVKRTPSLAALCKCIPDENILVRYLKDFFIDFIYHRICFRVLISYFTILTNLRNPVRARLYGAQCCLICWRTYSVDYRLK